MKFSVIIPVYNKEKYISRCLDSVLCQTYKDIEVIIADDGSVDGSGAICDERAGSDPRVKVLHMQNSGPGAARNAAMRAAHGDYYMFVDGDDYWLSSSIISDVAGLLGESNADVLSFERREFFNDNELPVFKDGSLPRNKVCGMRNDIALKSLLGKSSDVFASSFVGKAVKSSFMRENNLYFPEHITNGEDTYLTAQIIKHAKTYDRYNKVAYAARRTDASSLTLSDSNKQKSIKNLYTCFAEVLAQQDTICLRNNNPLLYKQLLNLLASPYVYALGMAAGALEYCADDEERRTIYEDVRKLKQFSHMTKHSGRFSVKLTGLFIRLFGIKFTVSMLRIYLKLSKNNKLSIKS